MYLGIEIGGTKLQLGVGDGATGVLKTLVRRDIDRARGAQGILAQIAEAGKPLVKEYGVKCVGYGFGGPVDHEAGVVRISHQVEGWKDFPLAAWTSENLGVPARLGNDCDCAALAEFRYGAGRGAQHVFYVTVGTGVGGGCVLGGKLLGSGRPAIAEIGHLRPGIDCTDSHDTVESIAAGPGIAAYAQEALGPEFDRPKSSLLHEYETDPVLRTVLQSQELSKSTLQELDEQQNAQWRDLQRRFHERPTAVTLGQAAREGNLFAKDLLDRPVKTLGWAIAQVITLIAPEIIVVGGGVSLLGEDLFFAPLRKYIDQYAFPPLRGSYQILPAALGEETVVHGAVALAAH